MSTLKIVEEDGRWYVWLGLEGDGDPSLEGIGFIIGSGDTRDGAVEEAVADLENCVDALQSAPTPPPEGSQ